jgi:HEAT repeat protein
VRTRGVVCALSLASFAFAEAPDLQDGAWDILNRALGHDASTTRAQAITALGSIGPQPRVVSLIEVALSDKSSWVRRTAASVLGEMKARETIPRLQQALDDESDEVSFAAAQALWQMQDRSGREILWEVLEGERKTTAGPLKSSMRDAKHKLHNPVELAKIGIKEGAGAFLGPFSYGMTFAEDLLSDKGAPVRALVAKLLASDDDPRTLLELENSLDDKNSAVRAAVARSLGERGARESIPKLEPLLADKNDGVKYMAAAAIIRLSHAPAARKSAPMSRPRAHANPNRATQPDLTITRSVR